MVNLLPNELLAHIFKNLDLKDLPDCRLVSRQWKYFVDEVKIKQLVVSDTCSSWRIWYQKLIHLEMFLIDGQNQIYDLMLPASLKTVHFEYIDNMVLKLNAPLLQTAFCGSDIRNIKFSHPESIKHLKIDHLDKDVNGDFQTFPNVEYFHCGQYSYTLDDADLDLIQIFPRAKEIHFEIGAMETDYDFEKLERVINAVIDQKYILRRSHIKIFCDGTNMRDKSSFRRYAHSW